MRWIGALLLLLALAALGYDVFLWFGGEPFGLTSLGKWWFWIHQDSLQVLQPAIERHVSRDLWDFVVQPLLTWPLAVELFVLGVLFLLPTWLLRKR